MANTLEYTVLRIFPVPSCVNQYWTNHCRLPFQIYTVLAIKYKKRGKESAIYKYMPDYHRLSVQLSDEKLGGDNTWCHSDHLAFFGRTIVPTCSLRPKKARWSEYTWCVSIRNRSMIAEWMRVNTESVDDCRMDACQYGIGRIPVLKGQLICFCSLIFNLNQVNISLNEYWRFQCHSAKFAQENSSRFVDSNLATCNSSNVISSDRYVVFDITVVLFDT